MGENNGGYSTRPKSKGVENPVAKSRKQKHKIQNARSHAWCVSMSWKYSQANDTRASQSAVASGLRAAARSAKFSARRGTGGGFGNLSFGAVAARQPLHPAVRAAVGLARYQADMNRTPTETKYFDTSFSANVGVANDWTGTEVPMTNYIQSDGTTVGAYTDCALIPTAIGAGYGNINGNQYYLKKLRVKGRLIPSVVADSADVLAAYTTRLCLVLDLQPQGAQAQGESVFSDMGGANQCDFSFLAMGAGSGGRFRILKDKLILHQPGVAGTDGASTNSVANMGALFNFSVNWRKALRVILKANSATPTVASLANCNIFLLAHSSGPQAGQPVIVGCSRAYYVD